MDALNAPIQPRVPLVNPDALRVHFNPSRERLWAKIAGLDQTLRALPQTAQLEGCWENLGQAKACIEGRWGHTHFAWRFLHRVDEDLLLFLPDDEMRARAVEVRTSFELNIQEKAARERWLGNGGGKGPLVTAVEEIVAASGAGVSNLAARHVLREVLGVVNDQVDRSFWVLSMNVLTALWSAVLLAASMVAVGTILFNETGPRMYLLNAALMGAAGAYVSNVLSKKDFVFVEGGPFIRYLLHPLLVKPVTSAFAAVFFYFLAEAHILFAIVDKATDAGTGVVAIVVPPGGEYYAYVIAFLTVGFAADKLLGDMLAGVLRRLEQNAEKTKASSTPTAATT